MAGEYPKREPFFAVKYVRMLYKVCAAQTLGPLGVNLLTCIALTEDAARYRGGVTFYNGQLMAFLGITKWDTIDRARQKSIECGFLHYANGGKRSPGIYWVVVPDRFADVDDSPMDEGAPTYADGYKIGWVDGYNACAKHHDITLTTPVLYPFMGDKAGIKRVQSGGNEGDKAGVNGGIKRVQIGGNGGEPPILSPIPIPSPVPNTNQQLPLLDVVVAEVGDISTNRKPRTRKAYTVAFEEFWEAYPLKAGKGEAAPAYVRAVKRLAEQGVENPHAYLVQRAKDYAASPKGRGEKRFIKQCSGWLNGDRWTDDASAWGSNAESSSPQAARSFTK